VYESFYRSFTDWSVKMKAPVILLFLVAACEAISFFDLVFDEWETFKVSGFYHKLFFWVTKTLG